MSTITTKSISDSICVMLWKWGIRPMTEYALPNGRRLDVAAICRTGRLLGVEIKLTKSDFNRDLKWPDAASQCFLFYIAVPVGFDLSVIHPGVRIIHSDGNHAWISRHMGKGLVPPHEWHKAGTRFAVNPAPGVDPTLKGASGDSTRARFWMP